MSLVMTSYFTAQRIAWIACILQLDIHMSGWIGTTKVAGVISAFLSTPLDVQGPRGHGGSACGIWVASIHEKIWIAQGSQGCLRCNDSTFNSKSLSKHEVHPEVLRTRLNLREDHLCPKTQHPRPPPKKASQLLKEARSASDGLEGYKFRQEAIEKLQKSLTSTS